jgi:AraC-like DNA-binding protein
VNRGRHSQDQFKVSSLLKQRLVELGISVPGVLLRAGLPPHYLEQETTHVTTSQLFALWQAIGEISGDPGVGLKLGAEPRFERYDPIQLAAVCSRNFRDALERIARCKILTCPEEIRVQESGNETSVLFVFLNDEWAEPALLVDVCFSWVLAIGQRGTDGRIRPLRLELTRDMSNQEVLESHFGCGVRFGSSHNAIVFQSSDLDRPFNTYNEELLKILGAQLDSDLEARQCAGSIGEQVKHALKRSLAGKRPSREEVARHLHLSVRTLQRRLSDAGTTFQQVLEETRRELARDYLGVKTIELSEAAFLLGYEDTNSFFRAFHDWEGTTPGEWRERHIARSASSTLNRN